MLLVVGATGDLGTAICRRLRDKGLTVRGLARTTSDPARVSYLRRLGVETARGDLKDRATLEAACQGVETVIMTASIAQSTQPDDTIQKVDQAGQVNLVDAAQAAGVRRFIYISYSKRMNTASPLTAARRTVEQRLMRSGLTYTILRPSFFMEVWLSPLVGFDYLHAKATIYGCGSNKLSWISRGDVAAFTVAALDNPAARNAILELGGPEALSPLEVVRIFERETGKPFEAQYVPEEVLRTQQAQAADSAQQSFAGLMLDYAKGDVIDMKDVLRAFSIRLLSVAEYACHVLVFDSLSCVGVFCPKDSDEIHSNGS
jgi:NADH dehydrogenase